jgi:hypothetical protein
MRTSPKPRFVRREIDRFQADPASMRNATFVIITVTVAAVLLGSLVMWVFDHRDFPDYGTALWFTLQTVTTVGYGDVTPVTALGRTVAGVVMIVAIAFLAIVTALITSTFIDAAQRVRSAASRDAQRDAVERSEARFDEVMIRLDRIEAALALRGVAVADPLTGKVPADPSATAARPSDPPTGDPPASGGDQTG